ncbi:MAG: magnesium transporter CorA family protein [Aeromicrobium sp.]
MSTDIRWVDLLDPTADEISNHVPQSIHRRALEQLLAPSTHDDEPRPKLEGNGDYLFGVLLVAVEVPAEDLVFYQELNLVMTRDTLLTVRKTPPGGRPPYDPSPAEFSCRYQDSIGMIAYHLLDDVAERFLDLVDALTDEIEELEEGIDHWDEDKIRRRISDLRHDMLNIRRTLSPLRDSVRQVVDNRIDFDGEEVFTREVELNFAAVYDKLLRSTDGIDLARDLVAGARDYHQAKVANDQNDVMKVLTVIASVLLLPTFIVGLYGQNFVNIPELHWQHGYAYGWALIIATTGGQLAFFRWKKWL